MLTPLYTAFGYILNLLYHWIGNYGVVILVFTFILKALLIPFSIKSTKNMMKQQALQPELDALKRKYKDDNTAFSQAQMELFKKHNVSLMGGCLPSLLGLMIIWPVFRIVSAPLTYISGVSLEKLQSIGQYLQGLGLITEQQIQNLGNSDIVINQVLHKSGEALAHSVDQGWIKAGELMDLNFLGLDMGLTPSFRPSVLFGEQSLVYLPLLIIPLLVVLSSFAMNYILTITNPNYKKRQEAIEAAKRNPARTVPADPTEASMKSMKYMLPLIMLFTSFTSPAALGLYWIASNIMAMVQQVFIYALYKKPSKNMK